MTDSAPCFSCIWIMRNHQIQCFSPGSSELGHFCIVAHSTNLFFLSRIMEDTLKRFTMNRLKEFWYHPPGNLTDSYQFCLFRWFPTQQASPHGLIGQGRTDSLVNNSICYGSQVHPSQPSSHIEFTQLEYPGYLWDI